MALARRSHEAQYTAKKAARHVVAAPHVVAVPRAAWARTIIWSAEYLFGGVIVLAAGAKPAHTRAH